jgi:hypothetical protein
MTTGPTGCDGQGTNVEAGAWRAARRGSALQSVSPVFSSVYSCLTGPNSKILNETRKSPNTKVVDHIPIYNFPKG